MRDESQTTHQYTSRTSEEIMIWMTENLHRFSPHISLKYTIVSHHVVSVQVIFHAETAQLGER